VQQIGETKDEFEPIHNPCTYAAGGPVVDPKMFYGRNEIITRIARNISENSRESRSFVIFGQKRSGKSSVLYHLKEKLLKESDLLILSLRLGSVTTEDFSFFHQFLWQILNHFKRAIEEEIERKKRFPLKLPFLRDTDFFMHSLPLSYLVDIFRLFYQFTEEKSTWHNVRVVILVDEFQYIYDQIVQAKLSPNFMKSWKALLQENIFSTVLVGQDIIKKFMQLFPNEFGSTQSERVRYLEREDAVKLIDEPIRIGGKNGESRYRGKTIEHILYLSAGNPFYIQMICNRLVEHMNRVKANFITEADIDKVKSEMLEGVNSLEIDKFDNLTSSGDNSPHAIAQDDALKVLRAIALK
jgi:AAA+ ATPase superfamily predicted ATPase